MTFLAVLNKFREYREPEEGEEEAKRSRPLSATTAAEEDDVMLPLGETILSNNLGLPIIVVTSKVTPCFRVFVKQVLCS